MLGKGWNQKKLDYIYVVHGNKTISTHPRLTIRPCSNRDTLSHQKHRRL